MGVELVAAMLACARVGVVHSVVFGGFSAEALAGRMLDARSSVVICGDGVGRGAKAIGLKKVVDDAVVICAAKGLRVGTVVVAERLGRGHPAVPKELVEGRDVTWEEVMKDRRGKVRVDPVMVPSEHPLFLLYTSGSTGQPKGMLHTTGGYMVYSATTFKYSFNYHPGDVFFCTADCGWITGHSYLTYGPLLNGATQVLFEGVPTYPDAGRLWDITDRYNVAQLYTAPTAIRTLQRAGDEFVTKYSRTSLKVLGTVGEPINRDTWLWYYNVVGGARAAIADTWWQTETGGHMITSLPIPGMPMKPGSASFPCFGVVPCLIGEGGKEVEGEGQGYLMLKAPWPGMARSIRGDAQRFEETYFGLFDGYYMTGDGCRRDKDGYYWIVGRVDDVLNVSGHRIGTAEVETALVTHLDVVEAAVVGAPHDIKGTAIVAFVTLHQGAVPSDELKKALNLVVRKEIGPIASIDRIYWASVGLPKTRSGKIMRRVLRKIAEKGNKVSMDELGDVSTLADPSVVDSLIQEVGSV